MQSEKDEANQKEGHCIADLVKCTVLVWSASLLTLSYLSIVPNMKMDNTFVASLLTGAMASFGIERKTNGNNGNQRKKIDGIDPNKKSN
jgi:hypothetical protein